MEAPKIIRLNIQFPDKVHETLKSIAERENISFSDVVNRYIGMGLPKDINLFINEEYQKNFKKRYKDFLINNFGDDQNLMIYKTTLMSNLGNKDKRYTTSRSLIDDLWTDDEIGAVDKRKLQKIFLYKDGILEELLEEVHKNSEVKNKLEKSMESLKNILKGVD